MTELERQIYVAKQINRAVQMTVQVADLSDEMAMEVADVYPAWVAEKKYYTGDILKYGVNADNETQLYRVAQDHTSQADWTPDATPALYKPIGIGGDGVPVWTQPYGAEDAYMTGDRVHYPTEKDPIYVSTVDNNVWEPTVYGWEKE